LKCQVGGKIFLATILGCHGKTIVIKLGLGVNLAKGLGLGSHEFTWVNPGKKIIFEILISHIE